MALMALSFSLIRIYTLRNKDLLEEKVDIYQFRKGTIMSFVFGPLMYLCGLIAGLFQPWLAFAVYFGIPVYFIFSDKKLNQNE
jgi:hypothetical protein